MRDHDDSLEPSPAELGDTMTVEPGKWTRLDDLGTQLYVYGDQPVDVAVQHAEVGDEIRQLRSEAARMQAELDVYRVGHNQLTVDPMHAGQPIHEIYEYADGESTYWLQQTHRSLPIWACVACGRVSVGDRSGCGGCGASYAEDLTPLLYEAKASCRSWSAMYGGQYDGPCLIAGSEGCDCVGIAEPGLDGRYAAAQCGATGTHSKHLLDGRDDLLITDTRPKPCPSCLDGGCFDCRPDNGPPPGGLTTDDVDGSPDQFASGAAPYSGGEV